MSLYLKKIIVLLINMDNRIPHNKLVEYLNELYENKYIDSYTINTYELYDGLLHKSIIENNIEEVKYILNLEQYYCDNTNLSMLTGLACKYKHLEIADYIINYYNQKKVKSYK